MPAQVSELLLPLRALVGELSVRERLPQIELAAADVEGRLQVVLVLRVLQPPSADDLRRLESFARERSVEFWLQPGGPQTAVPLTATQPQFLELVLAEFGVRLPFLPTDFTQVNHHVNAVLVSRAVRLLSPEPHDRVIDFFCGLGNFTLPLATLAREVVGYEGSATLVERARSAAASHGLGAARASLR
jgi:23S rRNA (uracil1939-C5)-methyltransferase